MARQQVIYGDRVFSIKKWRGVNENPDGDTQLLPGEAAEMRNFRITLDGNLQKRPGVKTIHTTRAWTGPVRGIWHGLVNGTAYTIFAAGGDLWSFDFTANTATSIKNASTAFTDAPTAFFGFSNNLYIMNGHEYFVWDGTMPASGGAAPVAGYVPLVVTASAPAGGGTALEQVNKLTPKRRARFSPNGSATTFQLPEKSLSSVGYVKNLVTGASYTLTTDYTVSLTGGTVTFTSAPATGTNTIEIEYAAATDYRSQVEAMKYAELYNGNTDNRVFIYGDGTNKAFYSGLDTNGKERADYFPDLNVLNVGSANSPITGLIRHFSQMAAFKTDSAYSIDYGTITLADGKTTAAFYIIPNNKSIGNVAYGQAQQVDNCPRTLFNSAVYTWQNMANSGVNLTTDERQAQLISRRVFDTMRGMDLTAAYAFDDNERREYYVIQDKIAVVHNYGVDAWYVYKDLDIVLLAAIDGRLYGCTASGDIVHISRDYESDNGAAIDCYWRSGSVDFGAAWLNKYSAFIYVTLKPESKASINITIKTNKRDDYLEKPVAHGFFSFNGLDFAHLSFNMNAQPQPTRLKIKAKKFAYYQLIFQSSSAWSTATILGAEIKFHNTGDIN